MPPAAGFHAAFMLRCRDYPAARIVAGKEYYKKGKTP
jgi:hypothetical protein